MIYTIMLKLNAVLIAVFTLLFVGCAQDDRIPLDEPLMYRAGDTVEVYGGFHDKCIGTISSTELDIRRRRSYTLKHAYCGHVSVDSITISQQSLRLVKRRSNEYR